MKKWVLIILISAFGSTSFGQSQEVQQLLLNWEKLTQLKTLLDDMYTGYEIIYKGYSTIKDISEGNFTLHKDFLDGLLAVSPVVQKYRRIADITSYQLRIVKGCKTALHQFKQDKHFTPDEIEHLGKVYSNLLNEGIKCLDELAMIITSGKLRRAMMKDYRLSTKFMVRSLSSFLFCRILITARQFCLSSGKKINRNLIFPGRLMV
jgi:hypothetical protein